MPRPPPPPAPRWRRAPRPDPTLSYQAGFIGQRDRQELDAYIATLRPLWELRYSTRRPLPPGKEQRGLLRPVYWLGNWQFACLGYYEPPRRTADCAVRAEPFPPVLRRLVAEIEARVRARFAPRDVPRGWHLNTCLINFYGARLQQGKWIDVARVGDHRDLEPGPVASLSLGERALFQFVRRGVTAGPPVTTQWLEDGSLMVFGGPRWKDELLHRVQRVEDRHQLSLGPAIAEFRTRRINLTLRYVPDADIVPFAKLAPMARDDVRDYVVELAAHSEFFARALREDEQSGA